MSEQKPQPPALSSRDRAERLLAPIMVEIETNIGSSFPVERFKAALVTAVAQNPDIFDCEPNSIRLALLKCAQDGLVPDNRLAALVPFKDNKRNLLLAQYIPMVQGIIQRARELGEVFSITANVVHENDDFVVDETDLESMQHIRPKLNTPRGQIIGAYVIFRHQNGRVIHREIMDREQIDKTRAVSRAKNSPAWNDWFSEMARKTVIRRGVKYVAMSTVLRQIVEREDEYTVLDGTARVVDPRQQISAVQQRLLESNAQMPVDIRQHVDRETGEITQHQDRGTPQSHAAVEGSSDPQQEREVPATSEEPTLSPRERGRAHYHAGGKRRDIPADLVGTEGADEFVAGYDEAKDETEGGR